MSAKVGHIILAHEALGNACCLVAHLAEIGSPVVVHIDRRINRKDYAAFKNALSKFDHVYMAPRLRCSWGGFSLVRATLRAAKIMLDRHPEVQHVMLNSGTSLPSRNLKALDKLLSKQPDTDFIESNNIGEDRWILDGLEEERLTLYFPFSWRNQRWLFDRFVDLQRWLGVKRQLPYGIVPHLGSQWWCLTSKTLRAILEDPELARYRRFFYYSWIPDESFFQSLVRIHGEQIESRSLTWSRFDHFGKPVILYDDHFKEIRATRAYFVRKVWPDAKKLYLKLLDENAPITRPEGRRDLYDVTAHVLSPSNEFSAQRKNVGRYPTYRGRFVDNTPNEFGILIGLKSALPKLQKALSSNKISAHGRLFDTRNVEMAQDAMFDDGNLPAIAAIRNRDPMDYVTNLLANTPDKFHLFFYDGWDLQRARSTLLRDPNAKVVFARHGWIFESFARFPKGKVPQGKARQLFESEQRIIRAMQNDKTVAQILRLDLFEMLGRPERFSKVINKHLGTKLTARHVTLSGPKLRQVNNHLAKLRAYGFALPKEITLNDAQKDKDR